MTESNYETEVMLDLGELGDVSCTILCYIEITCDPDDEGGPGMLCQTCDIISIMTGELDLLKHIKPKNLENLESELIGMYKDEM